MCGELQRLTLFRGSGFSQAPRSSSDPTNIIGNLKSEQPNNLTLFFLAAVTVTSRSPGFSACKRVTESVKSSQVKSRRAARSEQVARSRVSFSTQTHRSGSPPASIPYPACAPRPLGYSPHVKRRTPVRKIFPILIEKRGHVFAPLRLARMNDVIPSSFSQRVLPLLEACLRSRAWTLRA